MRLPLLPVHDAVVVWVVILPAQLFFIGDVLLRLGFVDCKAQARRGGQLDVAVDYLQVDFQQASAQPLVNLLLRQEIRDHGVDLQAGGERHRPNGAMRRDVHIVHLGHVGDLL